MDIIAGLVSVTVVLGLMTSIFYFIVASYELVANAELYERIKYRPVRILLNWITLIVVYAIILALCKDVGEIALELVKGLI